MSKAEKTSPAPRPSTGSSAGESFTGQLAALEVERADAAIRRQEAREAIKVGRFDAVREVTEPLSRFHADILFKRPGATPPEEREERERELSADLLSAVRERGLVVKPIPTPNGQSVVLQILDPQASRDLHAADAEVADLDRRIVAFRQAHAADLEAERKQAEADQIREAMAGDDPDRMRDVLLGRSDGGAFTTRDLAGHPVRRGPVIGR